VALGLPEDKAAVYQTRIEAGEFLLAVEVPTDKLVKFSPARKCWWRRTIPIRHLAPQTLWSVGKLQ